jgi:uncharacterized protein (UPF0276 family)
MGIGWRPQLAHAIDRIPDLGFVEITAENHPHPRRLPAHLRRLRERALPVIPHGIGLSLGGAEPVDPRRVDHLAALARELGSPLVSEHVAFVRAGGREGGHLLPLPRTRAALDVLVENVRAAQARLPVPLALENISTLFDWPADQRELDEAQFLCELVDRTDCLLLLDVANVYANARNLGGDDPIDFLSRLPRDRIAYMHVGGGHDAEHEGHSVYHDTHADPVPDGALDLLCRFASLVPSLPGIMLERDDNFPPEDEILTEMDRIRFAIAGQCQTRPDNLSPISNPG